MSQNQVVNVGIVTAYGAAKSAGYTGTYEQFCYELAHFAESAHQVAEDKETTRGYMNDTEQLKRDTAGLKEEAVQAKRDAVTAAEQSQGYARESKDYRNEAQNAKTDAKNWADKSKEYAEEIEDLSVRCNTLAPGSQATVEKSGGGSTPYRLTFGIPQGDKGDKGDKGNILFATFEIDEYGVLNAIYDDEYDGATFEINQDGYLEVIIE